MSPPAAELHVSFDVGIRNLAVATFVVDGESGSVRVLAWRNIDLLDGTNATKVKNVKLERRLALLHDRYRSIWKETLNGLIESERSNCCLRVHIERQHGRNKSMMCMAVALYVESLCACQDIENVVDAKFEFVSAQEKLKFASRVVPDVVSPDDVKSASTGKNYNKRKRMAVEACREIVTRTESITGDSVDEWRHPERGRKKRKLDDIADAMLQGLACSKSFRSSRLEPPAGAVPKATSERSLVEPSVGFASTKAKNKDASNADRNERCTAKRRAGIRAKVGRGAAQRAGRGT